MAEQLGINELKQVLKFAVDLGIAVDKAAADHKIDVADLQFLMVPLMSAGPAFAAAKQIVPEFKDLSAEEVAELSAYAINVLQLTNEKTELIVEASLKLAVELFKYVSLFKKA